MEQISTNIQDDGIRNLEVKPITGSQLFRKYLLNQCQEDFERGWVTKEAMAATKALKVCRSRMDVYLIFPVVPLVVVRVITSLVMMLVLQY